MSKLLAIATLLAVTAGNPLHFRFRAKLNGRIVGGEATTIDQVPYQVSLQYLDEHECGGSIISDRWVLTAGHCVGGAAEHFSIRAGSTNNAEGGSIHRVDKIKRHPDYTMTAEGIPHDDIALVRVVEPFVLDETRQPIELFASREEAVVGSSAVITGWGHTGETYPDILQLVEVPIVAKSECYPQVSRVPSKQICAGYAEGGRDACQGDSGGPLAIGGRLAGVVSWGDGCAEPGRPGVYTEIAAYRAWIKRNADI